MIILRNISIIAILLLFNKICFSQETDYIELFTSEWVQTSKLKNVKYLQNVIAINDSIFEVKTFNSQGKLLMDGTFSSLKPLIPNGKFAFHGINNKYNDCYGTYAHGELVGTWTIYNSDNIRYINYDSIYEVFKCDESTYDILINRDEMAYFWDGDPAVKFREFINEERFYPPFEELYSIEGTVIVGFAINERGILCNPHIIRNVNPNFDKEALRVILNSPKWSPTKEECDPFTFPVWFKKE